MTTKFLNISTDNKFTENSNILVPSQKATKEYIASKILQVDFIQGTEPTSFIANQLWLNTNDNKIYKASTDSEWDSGNLAQKDQLFTNNSLLYYYDGSNIKEYSSQTITEQNNNIKLKTWVGTQSEYDAIVTKDQNTEYTITDAYSDLDLILATQTEFNNSSTTKAATPYQVNQKIGNYLPLAGGNLNAGAILRLTNTNNEVTPLAFNTNGYLTVGSKLYINTETNTNTLVVRSGNIYKTDTSGDTVVWSNNLSAYRTSAAQDTIDANFVDKTTADQQITAQKIVRNNWITNALYVLTGQNAWSWYRALAYAYSRIIVGNSSNVGLQLETNESTIKAKIGVNTYDVLTTADKAVANGVASLDANTKVPVTQLPVLTGADGVNAGTAGLVPAPTATDNNKFLKGDGTWDNPAGGGSSSSRNVGEIVESTVPLTDAGLHLLDGSLLSGGGSYADFVSYMAGVYADHPELFTTEADWQTSVTNYGVCGKFVYDSVNNTVRLPKIVGFIEGASGTATLGDVVEAGLPNIIASVQNSGQNGGFENPTGAFGGDMQSLRAIPNGSGSYQLSKILSFNAANSNSIYGNSTTVQPQAVKVLYYIVIANSTKTEIEVDIDEIATDLNGKADADLNNISASVKSIDGQWVHQQKALARSTTLAPSSSVDYDLSTYLPNDNYKYEIIGYINAETGSTSGNAIELYVQTNAATVVQGLGAIRVCRAVTRTSSSAYACGAFITLVGPSNGRSIRLGNYANNGNATITQFLIVAYRRVGTNA